MTDPSRLVLWPPLRAWLARPARLMLAGLVLAASPLTGCSPQHDPYYRAGTWHPEGVNDMNIAAQVADPHDLVRGRDIPQPNYRTSAQAVADLWSGKTTKAAKTAGGAAGGAGAGATP
jgi:hypothetical protein